MYKMCIFSHLCFYCHEPITHKDNEVIKCRNCKAKIHDSCYEKDRKEFELTNEEKEITDLISFAKCPKCKQLGSLVVKITI